MLKKAPFLRFDRSTWTGQLVDAVLRKAGTVTKDSLELDSVDAIVALVRQGFGISVVPQLHASWNRDVDLRVVTIPGVRVVRHVGLLERSMHSRTQFTDAIKQHFRSRSS